MICFKKFSYWPPTFSGVMASVNVADVVPATWSYKSKQPPRYNSEHFLLYCQSSDGSRGDHNERLKQWNLCLARKWEVFFWNKSFLVWTHFDWKSLSSISETHPLIDVHIDPNSMARVIRSHFGLLWWPKFGHLTINIDENFSLKNIFNLIAFLAFPVSH